MRISVPDLIEGMIGALVDSNIRKVHYLTGPSPRRVARLSEELKLPVRSVYTLGVGSLQSRFARYGTNDAD